jgi:hypothetical protein
MAITLGKDCLISIGGTVAGVRSVTLTETARTIEINPFGSREASVYSTGYDCSVSVELNDSEALSNAFSNMHTGTPVQVTGGAGGFSFLAVITGISESDPIDGVASFTIDAKMTDRSLQRGGA